MNHIRSKIFYPDPDPVKCKTKLICFSKDQTVYPTTKVYLCGDVLPWVDNIKHVGNYLTAVVDGLQHDVKVKAAQYINTTNAINQEFRFAHPYTKWKLNTIYNFHLTGCELWDHGSDEFGKFMSTIQKSFKIAFDLPYATHRYYYEAITKTQHPVLIIRRRFLNFIDMIRKSKKGTPKKLLEHIENDVRSTTGFNLRNIMLATDNVTIASIDVMKSDVHVPVPEADSWKVIMVSELIDTLNNELEIENMEKQNLEDMLNNLCIH